jgi:hypothetical protein
MTKRLRSLDNGYRTITIRGFDAKAALSPSLAYLYLVPIWTLAWIPLFSKRCNRSLRADVDALANAYGVLSRPFVLSFVET